jgi:hypothetical protein
MPNDFASLFGGVKVTEAVLKSVLDPAQQAQLDADIAARRQEIRQRTGTTSDGDPLFLAPGAGAPLQHLATKNKGRTIGNRGKKGNKKKPPTAAAAAAAPLDDEEKDAPVEKKRRRIHSSDEESDEERVDQTKPAAKKSKAASSTPTRKKQNTEGPVFEGASEFIGQMGRSDRRGPRVETVDEDSDDEVFDDKEVIDLVEETWNANIDPKTREQYQGANKIFVLWIYDQYRAAEADSIKQKEYKGMLHTDSLDAFQKITAKKDAVEQDAELSKTAKVKEIKRLEAELSAAALALVKKASKDFHPVKNLAKMDVRMFISFLHTRKPVRKSKSKSKGKKYLSRSGYSNYRSALNELFRECEVERSPEILCPSNCTHISADG